jgi:hypothetical protein
MNVVDEVMPPTPVIAGVNDCHDAPRSFESNKTAEAPAVITVLEVGEQDTVLRAVVTPLEEADHELPASPLI